MPLQAFQSPSMPLPLKEITSRYCSTHQHSQSAGKTEPRLHPHASKSTGSHTLKSAGSHTLKSAGSHTPAGHSGGRGQHCAHADMTGKGRARYLGDGLGLGDLDDGQRNLDAHLVVRVVGLCTGVLLVGATTHAAAVIKDGDHGGAARLSRSRAQNKHRVKNSAGTYALSPHHSGAFMPGITTSSTPVTTSRR